MFKQIPTMINKLLIPRQKDQKIITEIDGWWWMKIITKGIPPLRRPKLSKKKNEVV